MYTIKILLLVISSITLTITAYEIFFKQKKSYNSKNIDTKEDNTYYIAKDDKNGQLIYEKTKNKTLNFITTNIKNKLELSWQFLYDITDIILKKFNSEDKNIIQNLGQILFKNGMKYEHVINYGINIQKLMVNKDKNKNIDIKKQ
jgi:hypothetical protein